MKRTIEVLLTLMLMWVVKYDCYKTQPVKCSANSNLKVCEEEVKKTWTARYQSEDKAEQMKYDINQNEITEFGGCRNARIEQVDDQI